MKRILKIFFIATFIGTFCISSIKSYASGIEHFTEYDSENILVVEDVNEYIAGLNDGTIEPQNTKIITYGAISTLGIVEDPSKSCSNILGHKWGDWTSWEIYKKIPTGDHTIIMIERWRFCERKYCGAKQREVDLIRD